jgi:hypothetical protein
MALFLIAMLIATPAIVLAEKVEVQCGQFKVWYFTEYGTYSGIFARFVPAYLMHGGTCTMPETPPPE